MSDDYLGIGKIAEAIEKGTREVRKLAKTYLEPIAKEKGALQADRIRFKRTNQAIKMMVEADRLLREAGIEHRTLNPKIVLPLLEHSSLETDEQLTLKWAGLLASSVASDPVHVSFPNILAELTTGEARFLDRLFTWQEAWIKAGTWKQTEHTMGKLRIAIGLSKEDFPIAAENLIRLQLVRMDVFWGPDAAYEREEEVHLHLAPLGVSFVRACRGPAPRPHAVIRSNRKGPRG